MIAYYGLHSSVCVYFYLQQLEYMDIRVDPQTFHYIFKVKQTLYEGFEKCKTYCESLIASFWMLLLFKWYFHFYYENNTMGSARRKDPWIILYRNSEANSLFIK